MECDELTQPRNIPEDFDDDGLGDDFDDDDDIADKPRSPEEHDLSCSKPQAAEMNKTLVSLLAKLTETAPAGSAFGVAAVKSAMAAANSAYESFAKVVKEPADMAEPNVTAAATAPVVKSSGTRRAA